MTAKTQFWNAIARKYAAQPIKDQTSYDYTLDRTRTYLPPEGKVLEIGAGTGATALLLAPATGQIIATDFSDGMMQVGRENAARQGIGNVDFVTAPAGDPRFGDGSHDAVLAFNLLHLLPYLDATLATVRAALRPGGYFISKTPPLGERGWYLPLVVCAVRAFVALRYRAAPPTVRFPTRADIDTAIQAAGFDIVETGDFPATSPSHFVVARRL